MAWDSFDSEDASKELAYDLRTVYAAVVGQHMKDLYNARFARDYPIWFKYLCDLYTVVKHKLEEGKVDRTTKEKDKTFLELKAEAIKVFNNYRTVYFTKSNDEIGIQKVEEQLDILEAYLYYKMNEAAMFGNKFMYDEDEI